MTFFQRKYLNGQEVHEKVLNITSHQRIKTKSEVSVRSATIKKTHTHTKKKPQMLGRLWRKRNPCRPMAGM